MGKVEIEEKKIGMTLSKIGVDKNSGQKKKDGSLMHKPLQQANYNEMHNAEKIVQFADYSRKTAFQFDSLPQNSKMESAAGK